MFANSGISTDSRAVGEIVQSPVNLELQTAGQWMRCDGRVIARSLVPEYVKISGAPGIFTNTTRTIGAQAIVAMKADATYFVGSRSTSATTQLQTSTDGITWTDRVGSGTVISVCCILHTGTRWIITSPTAAGQIWQNTDPTTTFTIATGQRSVSYTSANGLAYSPQLNRVVCVDPGATEVETSDDHGVTWTQRAAGGVKHEVVWTGAYFLAVDGSVAQQIRRSSDGITWVAYPIPLSMDNNSSAYTSAARLASDGAGTIVGILSDAINYLARSAFYVSKDHGDSWAIVYAPQMTSNATGVVISHITYANGMFFADYGVTYVRLLVSCDGLNWREISTFNSVRQWAVTYKAGVYLSVPIAGGTSAATFTEDTAKIQLPTTRQFNFSAVGMTGNLGWTEYIKVRTNK